MSYPAGRKRRSRYKQNKTALQAKEPMELLSYEGSRHMIPERLPSARKEKTVGIRVIDLNKAAIENIIETADTLKRLDVSDLHLTRLNEEFIGALRGLERLNLGNNELNDESFPNTFKKLDKLIELNLEQNGLTSVPLVMKRLKELKRLKLGHNKLTTTEGIERYKKLQILLLEFNQLEALPRELYNQLKRLEIFHVSSNRIREIHGDVRFLRFLKDVDLSGNKLVSLPSELLMLPRLEVLNASANRISRIPTINVKRRMGHKMTSIDLSDNVLIKFPEHLLTMTDKLDICKNKIKVIPGSTLKKLDLSSGQQLLIYDNPLVSPPQDICECGIRSIVQYFQEAKAEMKVYQGIKVLVLGSSGSGKTSLVQTLVDQQSRVTSHGESTIGVDMYDLDVEIEDIPEDIEVQDIQDDNSDDETTSGKKEKYHVPKSLPVSMWDFSGNKQYLLPHYFFIHDPALVMLVFNMAEYDDSKFQSMLGFWMKFVLSKTHKIILIPVGTMADEVSTERATEVCNSALRHLEIFRQQSKEFLEKEIKAIESLPHIPYAMSEQLKTFIRLMKVESYIHRQVIPVSSQDYTGISELFEAIEELSLNRDLFPNVMRVIPSLWSEVENYVEDRGWSMDIPFLKWEDYCAEITKKFGMRHLMVPITRYLNDTGRVIWYSEHNRLKNFVFLRPSWLSDIVKHIFRHNIDTIDYNMEENFKQSGLSLDKFNSITQSILHEGLIERDYLKAAWSGLVPHDSTKAIVEVLVVLLDYFELGYPLSLKSGSKVTWNPSTPKPLERSDSRGTIVSVFEDNEGRQSQDLEGKQGVKSAKKKASKKGEDTPLPKITKVVIPFIRHIEKPKAFTDEYLSYKRNPGLVATYRFFQFVPPGFFETMCVRALKPVHGCALLYNWQDGMYLKLEEKPYRILLQITKLAEDKTCVTVEIRHTEEVEDKEVEHMWAVLLPYLKDVEDLTEKFTGNLVLRHVGCPKCGDMLGFYGEWLTPKELQNIPSKKCSACHQDVSTDFLIQPKEKKRVEEFLLRKLKRDAEKRLANQNKDPLSEESKSITSKGSDDKYTPGLFQNMYTIDEERPISAQTQKDRSLEKAEDNEQLVHHEKESKPIQDISSLPDITGQTDRHKSPDQVNGRSTYGQKNGRPSSGQTNGRPASDSKHQHSSSDHDQKGECPSGQKVERPSSGLKGKRPSSGQKGERFSSGQKGESPSSSQKGKHKPSVQYLVRDVDEQNYLIGNKFEN